MKAPENKTEIDEALLLTPEDFQDLHDALPPDIKSKMSSATTPESAQSNSTSSNSNSQTQLSTDFNSLPPV